MSSPPSRAINHAEPMTEHRSYRRGQRSQKRRKK
jgi:hypothetical protein